MINNGLFKPTYMLLFLEKRNCRFPDETDNLKIFARYSQTACTFECRLMRAYKICRCYPWNIPAIPKNTRHTICDAFSNYCFFSVMNQEKVWQDCKCLPTCNQLEFSNNEQSFIRDPDEVCDYKYSIENDYAQTLMDTAYNPLLYKYLTITKWKNSGSDPNEQLEQWSESSIKKKLCKALVANHVAKVSVMFDKTKYVRTQRNLKVTFADQLGALGMQYKILFQISQLTE